MDDSQLLLGIIVAIFLLVISAIILFHWSAPKKYDYWRKNGVAFVDPLLPIQNEKPFNDFLVERHHKLGEIYGYFEGEKPKISIGTPALVKNILIKDFSFFKGRRPVVTGDEIHDKMLTLARGDDWKRIRSIVTPIFSTGKLKKMLHIFKDCSQALIENFKSAAEDSKSIDLKTVYGAFTTDVIAGAIFSAKVDSHDDPGNQFVRTARDVFGGKPGKRPVAIPLLSRLLKLFKTDHAASSRTEIFRKITLQIVEERRKTGQKRNDFLQLLMDSAEESSEDRKSDLSEKEVSIDTNLDEPAPEHQTLETVSKKISMNELVGQCLIFFLAGYETTSSTLSFVTYLLALHQDIQDKLREEVTKALLETNRELTYEALQNMTYLDSIISETLRLYPPATQLERYADADYKLGDTGITIPKGMGVTIPVFAVQRDPKFFPEPQLFNPDRFATKTRDPYGYLPFGAGPRNCVGMRFALLEIKICLSYLITNFKIKRSPQTKEILEFHSVPEFLRPKEIMIEMEIRKDSFEIK